MKGWFNLVAYLNQTVLDSIDATANWSIDAGLTSLFARIDIWFVRKLFANDSTGIYSNPNLMEFKQMRTTNHTLRTHWLLNTGSMEILQPKTIWKFLLCLRNRRKTWHIYASVKQNSLNLDENGKIVASLSFWSKFLRKISFICLLF